MSRDARRLAAIQRAAKNEALTPLLRLRGILKGLEVVGLSQDVAILYRIVKDLEGWQQKPDLPPSCPSDGGPANSEDA